MQARSTHRYSAHAPRAGDLFELILFGVAQSNAPTRVPGSSRATGMAAQSRLVLAADIGEREARIAATDIQVGILVWRIADRSVTDGPIRIPGRITKTFRALLREMRRDATDVLGVGPMLPRSVD